MSAKVVNINGNKFDNNENQTDVEGLLGTLQKKVSSRYNGCVVVMTDSTGKIGTEIAWVGLNPLEVVGALSSSVSMILNKPTPEGTKA